MRSIWLFLFILLVCSPEEKSPVCGFNLDLSNYIRHGGKNGSMFGFSIALYRNTNVNTGSRNWVIVGAPKLNISRYSTVTQPGGVFRCDILGDDRCSEVPFDSKGNQYSDRGEQIDTKSYQWLGATVASGGINGPIMACAPRYVFHTMQPSRVERIEPVGTCFTSQDFSVFTEYSPCRTNYWGYHRQGSCQAGFSAAITKSSDRLFIGAPGSWYWQGQVYSINTASKFPYKPPMYQEFGAGQLYMYDVTNPRNKVYATGESYSSDDDSYFGYSVTTGDFNGDGTEGVAVGMPRGSRLLGIVAIYSWDMVNQVNMTGKQIGAYFGYSLCSVDVDGDKLDDLIIGAPMFAPTLQKYDVGRIYIMLQGRTRKFEVMQTRDGINSRGRFGLALASLQDVNLDGYGDFAVGAPYDGPDNRGAVYIFYGSPTGPLEKHSQVIYAEDLGVPYPHTFGFSLAGGLDLDGNLYPDMAVGAYASDNIYVFKARPVAVVDATTRFASDTKLISLDDKRCTTYKDGKAVACTELTSCMKYNGLNLPEVVDFDVSWVLDSKKIKSPRMFFLLDQGRNIRNSTFRLERGKLLCRNETVYIVEGIRDKLTPLEVEMRYQLRGERNKQPTLVRKPRDVSLPVIDQRRETIQRDSISIQKNCKENNTCIPDLMLEVVSVDKYLLGSEKELELNVKITNSGEDAFEAGFYMTLPDGLHLKQVKPSEELRDTPISCTAPSVFTNYTLKCDIGNPLPSLKVANFKVILMPSKKVSMSPSYDFFMEANSTNPERLETTLDNVIRKNIPIWIETDLKIVGISNPEFVHYKTSDYTSLENATKEEDLGPHIVHMYNVRNEGPSVIQQAEVYIFWPYETRGGDKLMYLLNQPEVGGNVKCDLSSFVNIKNLTLDAAYANKSYLESIGAVGKSGGGMAIQQQGVRIDHSTTTSTSRGGSISGSRNLTEEETRKLEAEESIESTGDASLIHHQRAKEAANRAGSGGGYSYHITWNTTSTGDRPPLIHTSSRNSTTTYDAHGNPVVLETSTEYYSSHGSQSTHSASNLPMYSSPGAQSSYSQEYHRSGDGRQPYHSQSGGNIHSATHSGYNYNQDRTGYHGNTASNSYRSNLHNLPTAATTFEKAAQGGHGFQTSTLDVGTLNRGNVDDEIPSHSSSGRTTHYFHHAPSQSAAYRSGSNSYLAANQHSPSRIASPESNHNREISDNARNQFDDYAGSYDYEENDDHYSDYSSDNENHNYQRLKRQAQGQLDPEIEKAVHCTATRCAILRCVTGPLKNKEDVWIAIRTRIIAQTVSKLSPNVALNISTMGVSRVTRLPYIGAPKDKLIKSYETSFTATPEPHPKSDVVPLWVVVLSACAGAIILLLLIYLLYKCGFFNRNRPSDSSERQPLNRNGNYHGDEHL